MLVLARKEGETIHVGTSIVRIVKIKRGLVKLAIEADPEMQILRGELIQEQTLDLVEA